MSPDMKSPLYELRRDGVPVCASRMYLLGYTPEIIRDLEKSGLRLYKDGKREKPPRSCQTGSGKQNETTDIISEKKGKVK